MLFDLVVDPGSGTRSPAGDILYISWIDHDPVRLLVHQEKIIFYESMDCRSEHEKSGQVADKTYLPCS